MNDASLRFPARRLSQWAVLGTLWIFLALTSIPFVLMVALSFKTDGEIYTDFWGLPREWMLEHYAQAFIATRRYVANTLLVCAASAAGTTVVSSLSGYVFARHRFPFRETLFMLLLSLMMIPAILTLIPQFLLVKDLGLLDTRWALVLPYISGGQIFGILLCRTFISELPQDLFDAARIDGAREIDVYARVVVPLSLPILATIGIMTVFGTYNDYIWPLLVISDNSKQVFTVALMIFGGESNLRMGAVLAGYAIGSLPLLAVIGLGMKHFIQGVSSGALKA
mgnify:CR=1 FL=1